MIDPQTISATLEKPNALALFILGQYVLSKAYYSKDYTFGQMDYFKNLHSSPLGNGAYNSSTHGYLQVNLENENLKDKRVRQALTYGLDRKSIMSAQLREQGRWPISQLPLYSGPT